MTSTGQGMVQLTLDKTLVKGEAFAMLGDLFDPTGKMLTMPPKCQADIQDRLVAFSDIGERLVEIRMSEEDFAAYNATFFDSVQRGGFVCIICGEAKCNGQ